MKNTITIALLLTLFACGGSDDGLPSISITDVGDACEVLGAAYFEGGLGCGFVDEGDRATFGNAWMLGCCQNDGVCNDPTVATDASIDRCTDDIADLTCADVDEFTLPASCLNLGLR